jgi:hypothetical protein
LGCRLLVTAALLLGVLASDSAHAQSKRYVWAGYARSPQHDALADVGAQPLQNIRWQTPVDLFPQYVGTFLLIHYGSPLATRKNTIVVPVKTGPTEGFRVDGLRGSDGAVLWTHPSDYLLPPHNWTPSFSPAIGKNKLWIPAAGGTIESRTRIDAITNARITRAAFYGRESYDANPAAYAATVFINTPLTIDKRGNVFFGFMVTGNNPSGLESGIARVSNRGIGTWVTAAAASNDPTMQKVAHGSAPAVGGSRQVAVSPSRSLRTRRPQRVAKPASEPSAGPPAASTRCVTWVGTNSISMGRSLTGAMAPPLALAHGPARGRMSALRQSVAGLVFSSGHGPGGGGRARPACRRPSPPAARSAGGWRRSD